MKIFCAYFGGRIFFKFNNKCKEIYPLKSFPNLFLINPLIYSDISQNVEMDLFSFVENDCILATNGLIFGTHQSNDEFSLPNLYTEVLQTLPENQRSITSAILIFAQEFATNIRLASRQAVMSTTASAIWAEEITKFPKLKFPKINSKFESMLDNFVWQTAISPEVLAQSDQNTLNPKSTIYEKLLVDVIQAIKSSDFKKALLYSAIAMETITTIKLDTIYDDMVAQKSSSLKLIKIQINKSETIVKDPIFSFIREKAKFAELLHEVSLYVIGKSLKQDNPKLFEKTLKLYKTRNKIAHLGEPADKNIKNDLFSECFQDSVVAIETCYELLQWFGEKIRFPIIKFGFVKAHPPIIN